MLQFSRYPLTLLNKIEKYILQGESYETVEFGCLIHVF